ncbi:MAG: DUF1501 domain-containing protein [Planctomycetes bacterium]|nr:DUF1501 domain-containing protein [Planctomycetota bacterium]
MLRVFGSATRPCDGLTRREALRVGGLSLLPALSLPRLLEARERSSAVRPGTARSVVLLNLLGGPPHIDLFDLKPAAPKEVRGEFGPIDTAVPGVQISELLPLTSRVMDRCTLIRTYSHRYNSHNPYNVYTGFDLGSDRDNYFAKRSDHPSMGSVCQYLDLGSSEVPRYVILPAYPGHSQALRRAGPYGGYLGSRYDPLFTVWDKKFAGKGSFYEPTTALGVPVLPSLDSLADVTADRLDRRHSLLEQLDRGVRAVERSRAVESMSHFQQQVFALLTSPETRRAFDLSHEPEAVLDRYGRHVWGASLAICRRLVEAGSTFVSVNWEEADSGNHWDMHNNNFGMCRILVPTLDQIVSALILDLEDRGLLDSTLVVVMGEMGRTPKVNGNSGRDHWPQCGFVLLAGGGTRRGLVLGRTDAQAAYPADRPVSAGDLVATIYHLLGVDPTLTVDDLSGRPVHIAHGGQPVWEVIA